MGLELSNGDLVKILGTLVSMLFLYLFRRKIMKLLTDIIVGTDTGEYDNVDISVIKERIDSRLDEVLK